MKIYLDNRIDSLTKEVWEFYFYQGKICLDRYERLKRESEKSRTWRPSIKYNRVMGRNNTVSESDLTIPDEVKKQAYDKFMDEMSKTVVCKWSERNNQTPKQ